VELAAMLAGVDCDFALVGPAQDPLIWAPCSLALPICPASTTWALCPSRSRGIGIARAAVPR